MKRWTTTRTARPGALVAPRTVDAAGALVAVVTLALIAPAEYASGRALGLGPAHALTVPGVVEGFLAFTVLAGRLVPVALALTAGSTLLGVLRLAHDHEHGALDQLTIAAAVALTVAAVAVLAGIHAIRHATHAAAAALLARQAAEQRADDDARRAHQQLLADQDAARAAEDARLAREHADRAAREQRAHEREMERARAYDAAERARMDAEQRAAERAHELALTERAREHAPRQDAREHAPRARPVRDDVAATRRRRAHEQWAAREHTDQPMTGDELAPLLGVSAAQARKTARTWRTQTTPDAEAART